MESEVQFCVEDQWQIQDFMSYVEVGGGGGRARGTSPEKSLTRKPNDGGM